MQTLTTSSTGDTYLFPPYSLKWTRKFYIASNNACLHATLVTVAQPACQTPATVATAPTVSVARLRPLVISHSYVYIHITV